MCQYKFCKIDDRKTGNLDLQLQYPHLYPEKSVYSHLAASTLVDLDVGGHSEEGIINYQFLKSSL
jgi:hypothetical protein